MKKILLSIPLIAMLIIASSQTVFAITFTAENTLVLCNDGINNDGDLFTDSQDPDCIALAVPPVLVTTPMPVTPLPVPENTSALCSDGINNDQDLFTDGQDPDCAPFAVVVPPVATTTPMPVTPLPVPENTLALCTDGINNDIDLFVDLQDPDCVAFLSLATSTPATTTPATSTATTTPPTAGPEDTLALCTDGINNDLDLFVDLQDPDCAPFVTPATTTPATTTPPTTIINGGGGGGGGSAGPTGFGGGSVIPSGGLSLGDAISGVVTSPVSANDGVDMNCSQLFTTYIHIGQNNNVAEVTRLQAFLNKNLGTKINPTGFFGASTFSAVKLFQLKYADTILKPWDDAGLSTNLVSNPTGYVYKTTQRQINLLECPIRDIPMPMLP